MKFVFLDTYPTEQYHLNLIPASFQHQNLYIVEIEQKTDISVLLNNWIQTQKPTPITVI